MIMTLLEKAKQVPIRKKDPRTIGGELIELALAWGKDQVSYKQVAIALRGADGERGMTCYVALARGLREAIRKGILK